MDLSTYIMAKKYTDEHGGGGGGGYSAGTGINITGSTISVDADSAPTANSQKPITSGGTKSAIDASQNASLQLLSDTVGWTGKNKLPSSYYSSAGTSQGITWVINKDGTVKATGTATADSTFIFYHDLDNIKGIPFDGMWINGCPSGGNINTYFLRIALVTSPYTALGTDTGNGSNINSYSAGVEVFARIKSGVALPEGGIVFSPMIRLASVSDSTFEPYHESVEDTITDVYEVMGENGAKNKIPYTLTSLKANNTAGTWNNNAYTVDNHTFTVNDDLSITVVGSSASTTSIEFRLFVPNTLADVKALVNKEVILSGAEGAEAYLQAFRVKSQTGGSGSTIDQRNGIEKVFEWKNDCSGTKPRIGISVPIGTTASETTISPMLRLSADTDSTYQPYVMTNKELTDTKANNSALAPVENGATASQPYTQGEYFMRNGQFCTAKTAIASGATLTENSNYTVGDVGSAIELNNLYFSSTDSSINTIKKVITEVFTRAIPLLIRDWMKCSGLINVSGMPAMCFTVFRNSSTAYRCMVFLDQYIYVGKSTSGTVTVWKFTGTEES